MCYLVARALITPADACLSIRYSLKLTGEELKYSGGSRPSLYGNVNSLSNIRRSKLRANTLKASPLPLVARILAESIGKWRYFRLRFSMGDRNTAKVVTEIKIVVLGVTETVRMIKIIGIDSF